MITPEEFSEGRILLIDKPLQWSSFQACEQNQMGYSQALQTQENKNRACGHIRPACFWFIGDLYW